MTQRVVKSVSLMERWRTWAPVVVLFMLCVIITTVSPNFLSLGNFFAAAEQCGDPGGFNHGHDLHHPDGQH